MEDTIVGSGNPAGDAAIADPLVDKSLEAKGLGGQGADGSPVKTTDPAKAEPPTTLEQANGLLSDASKQLSEYREKLTRLEDQSKRNDLKYQRRLRAAKDGAATVGLMHDGKPDGGGKPDLTNKAGDIDPAKLAEFHENAAQAAVDKLTVSEAREEAFDYLHDYAKEYGMKPEESKAHLAKMEKFAKGETSMSEDLDIAEAYFRGIQVTTVINKAISLAVAENDAKWEAKVLQAGVPGMSSLAITGKKADLSGLDPLTRSVHEALS